MANVGSSHLEFIVPVDQPYGTKKNKAPVFTTEGTNIREQVIAAKSELVKGSPEEEKRQNSDVEASNTNVCDKSSIRQGSRFEHRLKLPFGPLKY